MRCNCRERGLDRLLGILDFSAGDLGIGCSVVEGPARGNASHLLTHCVAPTLQRGFLQKAALQKNQTSVLISQDRGQA
jgi:hypothetical protein